MNKNTRNILNEEIERIRDKIEDQERIPGLLRYIVGVNTSLLLGI